MGSYKEFRTNIKKRLPTNTKSDTYKIVTDNIESIALNAENHFKLPIDNIKFEIESRKEGNLINKSMYSVIAYPKVAYRYIDEESHIIKSVHGEFFIRYGKGNIKLMVTPAEEGGLPVTLEKVLEKLEHVPYNAKYDKDLLRRIVNDAEQEWYNIAEFAYQKINNAVLEFQISDDLMVAYLLIRPPGIGGADVTGSDIEKIIKAYGVSDGIKIELIDRLEKEPIFNQWIEIAVGKEAVDGEDSKIQLTNEFYDESKEKRYSKTKDRKTKNLGMLNAVQKGEVVAKKIMYTLGEEGYTVTGETLFPKPGNDIVMIGSTNVEISPDNMEATALNEGSLYVIGNKIVIDKIWEINSDVTPEIGDIDFPGSVIVHGGILNNYTVKVQGDLYVDGSIGSSKIEVGGNLYIGNGINGRGKGVVHVKGNLYAKYLESVEVKVGNICVITDSVINASIVCYNKVVIIEERGRVIHSKITAEKNIIVKSVGSERGDSTELSVVSYAAERLQLASINKNIVKLKRDINNKKKFFGDDVDVTHFRVMNEKQLEHVKGILEEIKDFKSQLATMNSQAKKIRAKLSLSMSDVSILVLGTIKEGSIITLNDLTFALKKDFQLCEFYINDKQIVHKPLPKVEMLIKDNSAYNLVPNTYAFQY